MGSYTDLFTGSAWALLVGFEPGVRWHSFHYSAIWIYKVYEFNHSTFSPPLPKYRTPIIQKPTKIPLRRNTPIPQNQRIRFRLVQAPGLPALLPGAVILGYPDIRHPRFNIWTNCFQSFQQLLRGEYYVLHVLFVVGVQHEHPIIR